MLSKVSWLVSVHVGQNNLNFPSFFFFFKLPLLQLHFITVLFQKCLQLLNQSVLLTKYFYL